MKNVTKHSEAGTLEGSQECDDLQTSDGRNIDGKTEDETKNVVACKAPDLKLEAGGERDDQQNVEERECRFLKGAAGSSRGQQASRKSGGHLAMYLI